MTCVRAFEIELEDLLLDPQSDAYRDFAEHCQGCADCASELALQQSLLGRLRGESGSGGAWHPSDAALLQLSGDPDALPDAERARIRAHLSSCGPCHDGYEAFRSLAATAAPAVAGESAWQRLRGALAGWGALPVGAAAGAAAALALVLVAGLAERSSLFGQAEPEPRYRGDTRGISPSPPEPAEGSGLDAPRFAVTLLEGETGRVAAGALPQGGDVLLRMLAPGLEAPAGTVEVEIQAADRSLFIRRRLEAGEISGASVPLELEAAWLAPGAYQVEVWGTGEAAGPRLRYTLEVE